MHIFLDHLQDTGAEIVSLESIDEICQSDVDVVVLHWLETVIWETKSRRDRFRKAIKLLQFASKPAGTRPKLVWMAHNLKPHRLNGKVITKAWPTYSRALTRRFDGVITLSPGTVPAVHGAFPALKEKPTKAIWHPAYPAPKITKSEARAALGLPSEGHVFGYCGQLKRYKNLEEATSAFLKTQDPSLRLVIAGVPADEAVVASLEKAAAEDPRILLWAKNLSAEEFETALVACDTALQPFKDYLHSGSMIHAVSAGCRILTPAKPFAQALQDSIGSDWVTLYEGALTPETIVQHAKTSPAQPDTRKLAALDPARAAQETKAFLQEVVGQKA